MPKNKKKRKLSQSRQRKRSSEDLKRAADSIRKDINTVDLSPRTAVQLFNNWTPPFKSLDKFKRFDWKGQKLKTGLAGVTIMRFEADSQSKLWVTLETDDTLNTDFFDDALRAVISGNAASSKAKDPLPGEIIFHASAEIATEIQTKIEELLTELGESGDIPAMGIAKVEKTPIKKGAQVMRFQLAADEPPTKRQKIDDAEEEKKSQPPIATWGRTAPTGATSSTGGGKESGSGDTDSDEGKSGAPEGRRGRGGSDTGGSGDGGDGGDDRERKRRRAHEEEEVADDDEAEESADGEEEDENNDLKRGRANSNDSNRNPEQRAGAPAPGGDDGDDDDSDDDQDKPNKKGGDGKDVKRKKNEEDDEDNDVRNKILREGWLARRQIKTIEQNLGLNVARQLMEEALASGHPSALAFMSNNLSNPNFQPFPANTAVVLGDAMRAWKRIESAIDDMLPQDEAYYQQLSRNFNISIDRTNLREQIVNNLLRNIQPIPRRPQGYVLHGILRDVADFSRGRPGPLLSRLNPVIPPISSALDHVPLDLTRFNLPSYSVIAQAEGVLAQLRGQTPFVTLHTLANQGGEIGAVSGNDRNSPDYNRTLAQLKARDKGNRLNEAELAELADIIEAARRDQNKPRIVTTNWDVLRVLLNLAPTDTPIPRNASAIERPDVLINGVKLDVHGIASPANPVPKRTETSQLGSLNNPISFGKAVVVTRINPFHNIDPNEPEYWQYHGYLYGYTPLGRALVLFNNGEILYTLSDTDTIAPRRGNDIPMNSIEHPRTRSWWGQTIDLNAIPESSSLREIADSLHELTTRQVAGSRHTVNEYTDLIRNGGFKSYIVGGATRDILIGKDPKDIDLASTMPAIDTFEAIVNSKDDLGKKSGRNNQLEVRRNIPFGTVQVQPSDETGLDIISTHDSSGHNASLRLDFDALARDFTVNAIYYDADSRQLIDPTGLGLADIQDRRVRFIQGTAAEVLSKEPVMLARWIKMMSKRDAQGRYFQAFNGDTEVAFKWLLHYADPQNMDERVRARFVDRMTVTAKEAEENVRRIFGPVWADQAAMAIRKIYGLQDTPSSRDNKGDSDDDTPGDKNNAQPGGQTPPGSGRDDREKDKAGGGNAAQGQARPRRTYGMGVAHQLQVFSTSGGGNCGIHAMRGAPNAANIVIAPNHLDIRRDLAGQIHNRRNEPAVRERYSVLLNELLTQISTGPFNDDILTLREQIVQQIPNLSSLLNEASRQNNDEKRRLHERQLEIVRSVAEYLLHPHGSNNAVRASMQQAIRNSNAINIVDLKEPVQAADNPSDMIPILKNLGQERLFSLIRENLNALIDSLPENAGDLMLAYGHYQADLQAAHSTFRAFINQHYDSLMRAYSASVATDGYYLRDEDLRVLADMSQTGLVIYVADRDHRDRFVEAVNHNPQNYENVIAVFHQGDHYERATFGLI